MIAMQATVGHHIDLDAEELTRLFGERRDCKQPGAGRAGDQDVQIATETVRATSRGAEDTDIVEAIPARKVQKVGTARRQCIMRQRPRSCLQALKHLDRDTATPRLIGCNIRLSNPGPPSKLGLAQASSLAKRSNQIHHG